MSSNLDWLLFKQGDQKAFERIYKIYIAELYSYGKKFSLDDNIVEDCIQDMFIDLWNKRKGLGNTDNIKAYLFVTIRRRIIRTLRKGKIISFMEEVDSFQVELAIDGVLEQAEMDIEQGLKLKKAFNSLTKNQQHILYLKYYQNFNSMEIAEMLKINYQSARNGLNRALIALRKNILQWIF
jgi:RNA polymerase sigma factor (sigma-70 family)